MSFCEWTTLCGGIVTSRRHTGRTSFSVLLFFFFFFLLFFSFFLSFFFFVFFLLLLFASFCCWLFCVLGRHLSCRSCSCCGRQHRYIQCPLGVCSLLTLLMMLLLSTVVRKPRVLWEIGNDCETEFSSVCTNSDISSDSGYWISSIALHSTSFPIPFYVHLRFCELHSGYVFTLVLLFFLSSTVAFVRTEVAVRDLVVGCSRPWTCFNFWSGAAAGVPSTEFFCPATELMSCCCQTSIFELAAQSYNNLFSCNLTFLKVF